MTIFFIAKLLLKRKYLTLCDLRLQIQQTIYKFDQFIVYVAHLYIKLKF